MNSKAKMLIFDLFKTGMTKTGISKKPVTENGKHNFVGLIQGFQLPKIQQNLFGGNKIGSDSVKKNRIMIPINNIKRQPQNELDKTINNLKEKKSVLAAANENNILMRRLTRIEKNKKTKNEAKLNNNEIFNNKSGFAKNELKNISKSKTNIVINNKKDGSLNSKKSNESLNQNTVGTNNQKVTLNSESILNSKTENKIKIDLSEVKKTITVNQQKTDSSAKVQTTEKQNSAKPGWKSSLKLDSMTAQKNGNQTTTKNNIDNTNETSKSENAKTFSLKTDKADTLVKSQTTQNLNPTKPGSGPSVKVDTKSAQKIGNQATTKNNIDNTNETSKSENAKTFSLKTDKADTLVKSQTTQNLNPTKPGSGPSVKVDIKSAQKIGNQATTKNNIDNTKETSKSENVKTFSGKTEKTDASVKSQATQNMQAVKSGSESAVKVDTRSTQKAENLAKPKNNIDTAKETIKPENIKTFTEEKEKTNTSVKVQPERNSNATKSATTHSGDQKDIKNVRNSESNTEKVFQKSDASPERQNGKINSQKSIQEAQFRSNELDQNKDDKNERVEGLKLESTSDRTEDKDRKVSKHNPIENSKHKTNAEKQTFKETIETNKSNSKNNTGKSANYRADDSVKNEMIKENQTGFKPQNANNSANFKRIDTNLQNSEINSDKTANINQVEITGMLVSTIRNFPRPVLSKTTVQQIVYILSTAKVVKNNTASFKIDGGDLGQLEIKFTKNKDESDAKILVVSEVSRAVIQKMIPTIQTELVEKGINLSSLEVEVDHSAQNEKNEEAKHQKENKQSVIPEILENDDKTNPNQKVKDYGYNTIELIA